MQGEKDLCFGSYKFDLRADQLWRDQENVKLTPKALAVLRLLVSRPKEVVTKDELFQTVWPDTVVSDDALTSCIQELRRALGDDARQSRYIETVHRRGFRFLLTITPQPVPSAEYRAPSQEEGVSSQEEVISSQYSVTSRQEQLATEQGLKSENHDSSSPLVQTLDTRHETLLHILGSGRAQVSY